MSVSYIDFGTLSHAKQARSGFWLAAPKGFVLLAALLACVSFWLAAIHVAMNLP